MISPDGSFKVLEFNCRFGDPETQVILPLLETPLEELLIACSQQQLSKMPPLIWKAGAAVCVVVAAGGYPGSYQKGQVITGIEQAEAVGASVFHAGTKLQQQQVVTDGGRILGVTGIGETFDAALALAYAAIDCIEFQDMYYRRDIGYRVKSVVSF